MANLHVQPKKKNYLWLWLIILAVIIAGAIYYFTVYKEQHPPVDNAQHQSSTLQTHFAQTSAERGRHAVAMVR